jgi:hypothetical protein
MTISCSCRIKTSVKFREERSYVAAEAWHKGSASPCRRQPRGRWVAQRTSCDPDAGHRGGLGVILACGGPKAHRLRQGSPTRRLTGGTRTHYGGHGRKEILWVDFQFFRAFLQTDRTYHGRIRILSVEILFNIEVARAYIKKLFFCGQLL